MSDWRYRRIFEILPGLIAWFVLIFPVLLGVFSPKWFAIVMIFFISYCW